MKINPPLKIFLDNGEWCWISDGITMQLTESCATIALDLLISRGFLYDKQITLVYKELGVSPDSVRIAVRGASASAQLIDLYGRAVRGL